MSYTLISHVWWSNLNVVHETFPVSPHETILSTFPEKHRQTWTGTGRGLSVKSTEHNQIKSVTSVGYHVLAVATEHHYSRTLFPNAARLGKNVPAGKCVMCRFLCSCFLQHTQHLQWVFFIRRKLWRDKWEKHGGMTKVRTLCIYKFSLNIFQKCRDITSPLSGSRAAPTSLCASSHYFPHSLFFSHHSLTVHVPCRAHEYLQITTAVFLIRVG